MSPPMAACASDLTPSKTSMMTPDRAWRGVSCAKTAVSLDVPGVGGATAANLASSSVSSPSAHDADCAEVDELLEGIDRVRIDDLWHTPRSAQQSPATTAPFREGLFAPPSASGIAAITTAKCTSRSKAVAANILSEESRSFDQQQPSRPLNFHFRSKPASAPPQTVNTEDRQPKPLPSNAAHSTQSLRTETSQSVQSRSPDPAVDFPELFKAYPCPTPEECYANGDDSECFYYHAPEIDRRRVNVSVYRPHMCRFIEEAGGCRKGDRCPFSHNDFERRYHPDRFGKETCRDFLRGDCPRRYCTFRHEVSNKVEISLTQIDAMNDKELLQLVLKISEAKGRALSEKLLRRFGHGKKHSGWRLEGFNPRGRDDQKVKYVTMRVEEVKKTLRMAGERKWAASLKTSSLRDMMSGVRKVAEEIRERYRTDDSKNEAGPEVQRLIRAVFSNTNWSCHSQEGDNPFLVTPENQNDAMTALERLVEQVTGHVVANPHGPVHKCSEPLSAPPALPLSAPPAVPLHPSRADDRAHETPAFGMDSYFGGIFAGPTPLSASSQDRTTVSNQSAASNSLWAFSKSSELAA